MISILERLLPQDEADQKIRSGEIRRIPPHILPSLTRGIFPNKHDVQHGRVMNFDNKRKLQSTIKPIKNKIRIFHANRSKNIRDDGKVDMLYKNENN
jgi:hypothetical protein